MRTERQHRTDAQLLRASRRDAAPFRELYERYAEPIHGYVLRRTRDADAAFDLTAETFAQAWLARRRFRDEAGGSAGPWLYGIARNLVAQSARRRRVELEACTRLGLLERLDREPASVEPDVAWLDGLDEPLAAQLPEALASLPETQRAALELRVVEGLDYDQVAAGLDTTPGAARVRVARGLDGLRQRLSRAQREAI